MRETAWRILAKILTSRCAQHPGPKIRRGSHHIRLGKHHEAVTLGVKARRLHEWSGNEREQSAAKLEAIRET